MEPEESLELSGAYLCHIDEERVTNIAEDLLSHEAKNIEPGDVRIKPKEEERLSRLDPAMLKKHFERYLAQAPVEYHSSKRSWLKNAGLEGGGVYGGFDTERITDREMYMTQYL